VAAAGGARAATARGARAVGGWSHGGAVRSLWRSARVRDGARASRVRLFQ
jgi:hypothetical protein